MGKAFWVERVTHAIGFDSFVLYLFQKTDFTFIHNWNRKTILYFSYVRYVSYLFLLCLRVQTNNKFRYRNFYLKRSYYFFWPFSYMHRIPCTKHAWQSYSCLLSGHPERCVYICTSLRAYAFRSSYISSVKTTIRQNMRPLYTLPDNVHSSLALCNRV